MNQQSMAINDWVKIEGQKYLEESMRKLNLDQNKDIRNDLHTLSLDYLNKAKKVVKNELKYYDECFKAQFGSLPNRYEKEPMRPLYVYQKKLKIAITQKEKEEGSVVNTTGSGIKDLNNINSIHVGLPNSSHGNDLDYEFKEGKETSVQAVNNQQSRAKGEHSGHELKQPKEESQGKGLKLNLSKLGGADSASNDKRAHAHKVDMEQRLTALMNRKAVLRNVLQQYQQEFLQKNVRRIKFHRDILPVENEQYEYKDVKKEIEQIEIELYGHHTVNKKDDFM